MGNGILPSIPPRLPVSKPGLALLSWTTAVFSDDFESYLDGDSLDTDNAASPYNSSTSEATVGVEE